jgi:hypothetical protein
MVVEADLQSANWLAISSEKREHVERAHPLLR